MNRARLLVSAAICSVVVVATAGTGMAMQPCIRVTAGTGALLSRTVGVAPSATLSVGVSGIGDPGIRVAAGGDVSLGGPDTSSGPQPHLDVELGAAASGG
jgi:hypothetical protein